MAEPPYLIRGTPASHARVWRVFNSTVSLRPGILLEASQRSENESITRSELIAYSESAQCLSELMDGLLRSIRKACRRRAEFSRKVKSQLVAMLTAVHSARRSPQRLAGITLHGSADHEELLRLVVK